MSPKAPLSLNRFAVAAALSLAAAAAQAESPYLSASIKLSNLSFQLIDLNPNDGVAPSMTILTKGNLSVTPFDTYSVGFGNDPVTTVVPFASQAITGSPLVDFSAQSGGVGVSTTSNSLSMQTSVKASELIAKPATVETNTYDYGPQVATYTYSSQVSGGGNDGTLSLVGSRQAGWNDPLVYSAKLSANTALIVTGQAAVDVHIDRTMLDTAYQQVLADYGTPELGTTIDANSMARAYITMSLYSSASDGLSSGGFTTGQDSYSSSSFRLGTEVYADALSGIQLYDPSTGFSDIVNGNTHDINKQRTFSLVSFNNTGLDIDLSLDLQAQVTALQSVQRSTSTSTYTDNPNYVPPELPPFVTPDPSVPTIPEPSTYALMGLGLVGIALASRRQRPTAKA
jgi:hypothetical protein